MFFLKGKLLAVTLLIGVFALSGNANAGFVSLDWKVEGDNKATLHEETGLEWLKMSETDSLSINTVKSLLDTTYSGWRLPTEAEVNQLLLSALPTFPFSDGTTAYSSPSYQPYASAWRAIMGDARIHSYYTTDFRNAKHYYNNYYSYSLYEDPNGTVKLAGSYLQQYYYHYSSTWTAAIYKERENAAYSTDYTSVNVGIFLVSDGGATLSVPSENGSLQDVPEPAGALILASGLFGLAMLRRKKAIQ